MCCYGGHLFHQSFAFCFHSRISFNTSTQLLLAATYSFRCSRLGFAHYLAAASKSFFFPCLPASSRTFACKASSSPPYSAGCTPLNFGANTVMVFDSQGGG